MSDREIMGVPARIMRPRILVVVLACALTVFGLVMIFSASSAEAYAELGDAAFYVRRQALFIVLGLLLAAVLALVDYHWLCGRAFPFILMGMVVVLLIVRFAGSSGGGATRWFAVGPVRLQPSEFAKIVVLLGFAKLASDYFGDRSLDDGEALRRFLGVVAAPLALILLQPDNGTTAIIGLMVFVLAWTAGMRGPAVVAVVAVVCVIGVLVVVSSGYAADRITIILDPWADQYDNGYQLTRGFMAFGSGGLFGQGLGMSRMKYSYLPEAHNDFIFAVIGEELGLVGTLAVLAAFAWLFREGLEVARNSSDLTGRLIATGAVTLLAAQMGVNMLGVLGVVPLSGKPLPFISYGGSSIMATLGIMGTIVNVSLRSELPETVHDVRRRAIMIAPEEDTGVGEARRRAAGTPRLGTSVAGGGLGVVATPGAGVTHGAGASLGSGSAGGLRGAGGFAGRGQGVGASGAATSSARRRSGSVPLASSEAARRGFRVVEGGAGGGRDRIDLGPTAAERLRPSEGPTLRGRGGTRGNATRDDGSLHGRRPRRG